MAPKLQTAKTLPAIPALISRTGQPRRPTLIGVSACAQAPQVVETPVRRHSQAAGTYRTIRRNATVREAIRIDYLRRS